MVPQVKELSVLHTSYAVAFAFGRVVFYPLVVFVFALAERKDEN